MYKWQLDNAICYICYIRSNSLRSPDRKFWHLVKIHGFRSRYVQSAYIVSQSKDFPFLLFSSNARHHFSPCLSLRETRHDVPSLSCLILCHCFREKRTPWVARIKDTTCGFPLLFSLAPLFSLAGNDEKCPQVFITGLSPLPLLCLVSCNHLFNYLPLFFWLSLNLIHFCFRRPRMTAECKAPKILEESLFPFGFERKVPRQIPRWNVRQMDLKLRG